jgi:hypothetical protein
MQELVWSEPDQNSALEQHFEFNSKKLILCMARQEN